MHATRVRKELAPGTRIRVLVVDGSLVVRQRLAQALEGDPSIEVVGVAASGVRALERIAQWNPDVLTLDLEGPGMNGLETLRQVRRRYPEMRVILLGTGMQQGSQAAFEALARGVDDYVMKTPDYDDAGDGATRLQAELVPKIKQFFKLAPQPARTEAPAGMGGIYVPTVKSRCQLVVIGVSTGGPAALAKVLPRFAPDFPLPVLVVQHMPAQFTRLLAERLAGSCPLRVKEATEGALVQPGRLLLAPGDFHMRVRKVNNQATIHLDQSPPENSCRPSVDVLFRSAGEVYGGSVMAVVLTGMGHDGLRGAATLKVLGATILVQDEASSVVWGMPGAVATAGLADAVVPLDCMVPEIVRRIQRS